MSTLQGLVISTQEEPIHSLGLHMRSCLRHSGSLDHTILSASRAYVQTVLLQAGTLELLRNWISVTITSFDWPFCQSVCKVESPV